MRWGFGYLCLVLIAVFISGLTFGSGKPIWVPLAHSEQGRGIRCDETRPQMVRVAFGRLTVINFPFQPQQVVPGQLSFDFKQIRDDLIIKALRPGARTNLLVYLEDRRCAFDLISVAGRGDDVLVVRDPRDEQMGVNFNE